ncbi:Hemoglobin and proliferation regulated protein [Giardia lamblia P15]|uniref:Adenylate kinase isoenzyme 6 homolog n=1 Tax=Giardia intestinalis (strain P15) TaxID=658858 RepID=E1EX00_GIAIA|nr:Hemoglobin and proliferation regulated protein [Giardia lamblia P15]
MRILITGTPGVGKTTLAKRFLELHPDYRYVNVSDLVHSSGLIESYDEIFDSIIPDEERLLDTLEVLIQRNKNILVDHHSCERFPVRWFDIVVLLRLGTEALYDRLALRGYSSKKILENIEAEIMGVAEDAVADFDQQRVIAFTHKTEDDTRHVLARIEERLHQTPRSVKLKRFKTKLHMHRPQRYYVWMWHGSISSFYKFYRNSLRFRFSKGKRKK